jgi:hypothetical protein
MEDEELEKQELELEKDELHDDDENAESQELELEEQLEDDVTMISTSISDNS